MGKNTFKIAIAATLGLLIGTSGFSASGSEPASVTIRVLNFDGTPASAQVTAIGVAQPSQSTNSLGETAWKLQSGTQSFQVQFKPRANGSIGSTSYTVPLFLTGSLSESHRVQLPEQVETLIPISSDSTGPKSIAVTWDVNWLRNSSLLVNGKHVTVSPTALPSVLQVEEIGGERFIRVGYSKSIKLARPESSDIDGDLVPDFKMNFNTRFGKVTFPVLSSVGSSKQQPLSLANVPWVAANIKNEDVELSVISDGVDITSELGGGYFSTLFPDGNWQSGIYVKDRKALYSFTSRNPEPLVLRFAFSLNNIQVAVSEALSIQTVQIKCASNDKGWLKQVQSLGDCPVGWTPTATLAKLSEKKYSSCAAMNKVLVGGVGKFSTTNKGRKVFRQWLPHTPGYNKNKHLDSDKDGIACER